MIELESALLIGGLLLLVSLVGLRLTQDRVLAGAVYVIYPPNFFLLFVAVFFLLPAVVYVLNPPGMDYRYVPDGYSIDIWALTVLYGAAFSLVAWVVARRVCGPLQFSRGVGTSLASVAQAGKARMFPYLVVFWVIPLLSMLFLLTKFGGANYQDYMVNRTAERKGMGYLIVPSLWLYVPVVLLLAKPWFHGKPTNIRRIAMAGVAAAALTAVHLYLGSKSRGLIVVVFMFFSYLLIKGGGSARLFRMAVMGAVVIGVLFFVGLRFGDYREAVTRGAQIEDVESRQKLAKVMSSLNAVGSLENTAWVVQNVDSAEYSLGSSFWAIFAAPIPRDLWPDKPVGGGPELRNLIHPGSYDIVSGYQLSSYSPGLVAESYMSFGFFGILLVAPIYGLILGWYGKVVARLKSDLAMIIWPMGLYTMVFAMTAEVMASVIKILMLWAPFWIYKAIVRLLRESRRRRLVAA